MAKFHIKKGDTVVVITGESKGQQGKVLEMNSKTSRVLVEGVNMAKKHTKPNAAFPNGGIIEKEASIHISNLMLVDSKSGTPTRIGRKLVDGKLQRFSKKSGEAIK
jgi:large subunit ribosomal protein L24